MEKNIPSDETGYVGISYVQNDSISVPIVCPATVGITFVSAIAVDTIDLVKGDIDIIEIDSATLKQTDTIPFTKPKQEVIFMGDSIYEEIPLKKPKVDSSAKTKNPPKADSINCNTIKNYY